MIGSLAFLAFAAPALGPAGADTNVTRILEANRAAIGAMPPEGTLVIDYSQKQSGLAGTTFHVIDLASGAFVERTDAIVISQARGFDGRIPWQTDVSGVSTEQLRGDRIPVAVNQAYRNANRWWRPDRGGAKIVYLGQEKVGGRPTDHLSVIPPGGGRFEAWFDRETHYLVQTAEPQQFFQTRTSYGDYERIRGRMIPRSQTIDFGNGDPEELHATKITFAPARKMAAFARPTERPPGGQIEGGRKSVTLPFRLLNNHVYVEARVNGKGPYTFIVDTGGHTLISPRVAREAGLKVVGAGVTSGAGEKSESTGYARYREIALGAVRLTDQPAFITNIYQPAIEGIPVDGMVGFELFARFAIRIDYGSKTMTLTEFDAFRPDGSSTPVPFNFYDHLPSIDGRIDNLPAHFDIDTGSRSEIDVTSPFVAQHRLRELYRPGLDAITGWGVGGASHAYVVRMPSITIGTVKVPGVVTGLSKAKAGSFSDPSFDGNIGSGLLKRFVATFDYSRQIMYLKPLDPQPADAGAFDRSGMWINAAKAGYVVEHVSPDGPADQAGLLKGDVIIAINGDPPRAEALSAARTMLKILPAGSSVKLMILREGKTRTIELRLRELI
jgi:hypothetical protein